MREMIEMQRRLSKLVMFSLWSIPLTLLRLSNRTCRTSYMPLKHELSVGGKDGRGEGGKGEGGRGKGEEEKVARSEVEIKASSNSVRLVLCMYDVV